MATAKSLQKPKIIHISSSVIRVAHPDLSGAISTTLAAQIAAAGTAMSVLDNDGFEDNDWFVVGEPGDNQTEECDVNGAVTRGQSMTITNSLKFGHELDAPVTRILERKIIVYGAATDGGAGTVITSISASGVDIQWNKPHTEINLLTTDTAYAYYYATFYDGTTASSASDYVAAAGISSSSVESFIRQALDLTNTKLSPEITRAMCVNWANDCQNYITQFSYRDSLSNRIRPKDWSFEMTRDFTSITTTQNENEYLLSALSSTAKYTNTGQAIISVQIGDKLPLEQITAPEMDIVLNNQHRTELSVAASAADTSISVDDTSAFSDSGTLQVGTDSGVTYTAKTSTTFTGIPAADITATQAIDSIVLQGRGPGVPIQYCIEAGKIRLDVGVDSATAGNKLKVRFFKKLTALTEASDVTSVTFADVFHLYIGAKIFERRSKMKEAQLLMAQFEKRVMDNAAADQTLPSDSHDYYIMDSWNQSDRRPFNY